MASITQLAVKRFYTSLYFSCRCFSANSSLKASGGPPESRWWSLFKRNGAATRDKPPSPLSSASLMVRNDLGEEMNEKLHLQMKIREESIRSTEEDHLEKFIPVTRGMLVKALSEDIKLLTHGERESIEGLSAGLDIYISQLFYTQLEEMKKLYDSLDPDKDTIQEVKATTKELLDNEYWLLQKLELLLYKANYFKIPRSISFRLIQEHDTSEGVRVSVNPQDYATLRIWTRGRKVVPSNFFQKMKFGLSKAMRISSANDDKNEVFTRVFVAVRSQNEKKLHFKVFKDVPCNQLEYLLPDGKIMMSRFDKGFLASSVFLGTTVIAAKMIAIASDYKLDLAWIGMGIAGLIGARGWIGYKNKRNKYLANLSRTLYFKTISNNRGVLTLLTDRGQDEEFKECLLAYAFLLSPVNRRGIPGVAYTADNPHFDTSASLQVRIEKWLQEKFNINDMQFDIDDALLKLDKIGLLVRHPDDTLSAIPMEVALDVLPQASSHWLGGISHDSESIEDGGVTISNEAFVHHQGWR
jgi:hypothetical protein